MTRGSRGRQAVALRIGALPLAFLGMFVSMTGAVADPAPPELRLFDGNGTYFANVGGPFATVAAGLDVNGEQYSIKRAPGDDVTTVTVTGSSLQDILTLMPTNDFTEVLVGGGPFGYAFGPSALVDRADALTTGPEAPVVWTDDTGTHFADSTPDDYVDSVGILNLFTGARLSVGTTVPPSIQAGQSVTLSATSDGSSSTSYEWDDLDTNAYGPIGHGAALTHTFAAPGTYHLRVIAVDGESVGVSDDMAVEVGSAPPGTPDPGGGKSSSAPPSGSPSPTPGAPGRGGGSSSATEVPSAHGSGKAGPGSKHGSGTKGGTSTEAAGAQGTPSSTPTTAASATASASASKTPSAQPSTVPPGSRVSGIALADLQTYTPGGGATRSEQASDAPAAARGHIDKPGLGAGAVLVAVAAAALVGGAWWEYGEVPPWLRWPWRDRRMSRSEGGQSQ